MNQLADNTLVVNYLFNNFLQNLEKTPLYYRIWHAYLT